ncbi:histidinol-phosphate transaminase [Stigmatella aurantiaca]|uniref:Histidinol-phosphate aminotransferase n=1 Tax=Stigmatella aurantiaca (strain DW4/3-1) TaxID=378806 RepID=Q08N38_STIAD|nr:histidinol-phosphate transaminase [Stigmatella aurantiaca]ADO72647.1 Histidinol-phosphate aminotransferase [Stigmatella aurantiaca DW4/3-1]EAU61901.1 histidinol-phosphate aminotransferase [Stigmatella aurantiaca DW4/3-1]
MKPVLLRSLEVPSPLELDSNENPLGPSRRASKAIQEALSRVNRYPERDCFATEERLARLHKLSASHVALGPGSFGVLRLLMEACMPAGSEAIHAEPSYPMYRVLIHKVGGTPVAVPLTPDHRHDLVAMGHAIGPATRLVIICNPNNPTGRMVSSEELDAFMDQVPPHVMVVIDEAYYEYAEGPELPNAIDWIRKGHNLVVLRTFSKVHGLAGLRIGYGVAQPQVAAMLRQMRGPFAVTSLAQVAAQAALDDRTHVAAVRVLNEQVRSELCSALDREGLHYIPSVTNFVMIRCGGDDVSLTERLSEVGVRVRPGTEYGMRGWLRVTVGTSEQTQRFVSALLTCLDWSLVRAACP